MGDLVKILNIWTMKHNDRIWRSWPFRGRNVYDDSTLQTKWRAWSISDLRAGSCYLPPWVRIYPQIELTCSMQGGRFTNGLNVVCSVGAGSFSHVTCVRYKSSYDERMTYAMTRWIRPIPAWRAHIRTIHQFFYSAPFDRRTFPMSGRNSEEHKWLEQDWLAHTVS